MTFAVTAPHQHFTEANGTPLEDGEIFIGVAGLDAEANPQTIYWDEAGTIVAAQPIKTKMGAPVNGAVPSDFYVNAAYSMKAKDKNSAVVYSALQVSGSTSAILDNANNISLNVEAISANATTKLNKNFDNVADANAALQNLMPDGYCPQPDAPRFNVTPVTQGFTATATRSVIDMNGVPIFNSGDFDLTTNVFTVPSDGLYFFGYNLRIDGINAGYFRVEVRVNGVDTNRVAHQIIGSYAFGNYFSVSTTDICELSKDDYVELTIYSNSDTAYTVYAESDFYGFKVH